MRRLFLVLLLLASTAAGAAERHFAVLSLIGDKLLVVQYYPNEGFRNDSSLQALVSLDDNSLDKTALQAVDQALKQVAPTDRPVLLVARDTSLYEKQSELLRSGQSSKALLPSIGPLLRGSGATHLILLTKLRSEARVQSVKDIALGSGMLEGLGFYVDTGRPAPNAATGVPAAAVLGPFAYMRFELIDLGNNEVVREEKVVASRAYTAESGNAWSTLSNSEKIAALQDIIRRETAKTVPSLVRLAR
jgi:hypothetical protein